MIARVLNNSFIKGVSAIGMHCEINERKNEYAFCHLKKVKGNVELLNHSILKEENIEILGIHPIYLSISGRGVLHFKGDRNSSKEELIEKKFPNIKLEDIYIQEVQIGEDSWISIIRLDELKSILAYLKEYEKQVIKIELGFYSIANYHLIRNEDSKEVQFILNGENWIFNSDDSLNISKVENEDLKYPIDDNTILNGPNLASFMHALNHFDVEIDIKASFFNSISLNQNEFIQKRVFQKASIGILAIFFISLMINFIVFSQYSALNNNLNIELNLIQEQLSREKNIKQQIAQNRSFIEKSGFEFRDKLSFMADRIAATLPIELSLTELAINPKLKKKYNLNESPEFEMNRIVIQGKMKENYSINEWVKKLSDLEWIKNVDINNIKSTKDKKFAKFLIDVDYQ